MNKHVKFLQQFLNHNGAHLVEDGSFGAKTTSAIENLLVPKWIKVGMKEVGTLEVLGSGSNPRIGQYHTVAGLPNAKDQVPWCGSAMAFVFVKSGYRIPKGPARALSWCGFGYKLERPVVGCVAVKYRDGGGHCGIVIAIMGEYMLLMGGNQTDAFNIKRYRIASFSCFRYPTKDVYPIKLAYLDTINNIKES